MVYLAVTLACAYVLKGMARNLAKRKGAADARLEFSKLDAKTVGQSPELIAQLMAQLQAKAEPPLTEDSSPLWALVDANDAEGVKAALRRGAALEPSDASGCTPLLRALQKGSLAAARVLLECGANANAVMQVHPSALGSHPHGNVLMTAIRRREVDFLRLLLDSGVSIRDAMGESAGPLLAAAELAEPDILETLLSSGADVNVSYHGRSPLHLAAATGRNKSVRLLLARGAKVDAVDADGRTPLWLAVHTLKTEVVALLVKAGAEAARKDLHGKSPLDCAKKMKATIAASFRTRVEKMIDILAAATK